MPASLRQSGEDPPVVRQPRHRFAATASVLLVAAWLRFDGIGWGKPFTYHPDEHAVLHAALNMVREGDPNPRWFRYPSFLPYLQALLVAMLQPWVQADLRTAPEVHGVGPWDVAPQQFPFLLAGRAAVAAFGVAGVYAIARLAGRWCSPWAAWMAAAALALSPLHIESSHYLTTDVPAMLWVALTLCLALPAASLRTWLLAGAAAGLATATKYPAGMVVTVPLCLAWLRCGARAAGAVAVGCAAAFFGASPFVCLDVSKFLADLEAQRAHYASGGSAAGNWWRYLLALAGFGFGALPLLVAASGASVWLIRGPLPRREVGVLLLVPVAYWAYLSTWPARFDRNLMPVLPFLCLFVAAGWDALRTALAATLPALARRGMRTAAAALLFLQPALSAWQLHHRWHALDTRTEAYRWIEANVPAGTTIAREEYTPQVDGRKYRVLYVQVAGTAPYSWYLRNEVDYLVLSSNIYGRFWHSRAGEAEVAAFYTFVFQSLPLAAEFVPGQGRTGPTIRIYEIPRWRGDGARTGKMLQAGRLTPWPGS